MPIAIGDEYYDNEFEYTAKVLGIQLPQATEDSSPKPEEASGSSQTQGGTQVPPKDLNASAGNVAGVSPIVEERYQTWPERMVRGAISAMALPGDVLSGKVQPGSAQEIERAMDLAGLMVMGPAPVASKMAEGTLGSFAGVKSKALPKEKLYEAQNMETSGASADDIWEKTGFYKDKSDGRWKYEINDQGARLVEKDWRGIETGDLKDFYDHPELFKAYPELKDVNFVSDTNYAGIGSYNESTNTLKINPQGHSDKVILDVIQHELQHKIQSIEGFSYGSSPAYELRKALTTVEEKTKEFTKAGESSQQKAMLALYHDILVSENKGPAEKFSNYMYSRKPGEIEANLSMARRELSDEQRKFMSPEQMLDWFIETNTDNTMTGQPYRRPFKYPGE